MDITNDPALRSWVDVPPDSHFPIQNLPYGVFRRRDQSSQHIGVAIGDMVLDLRVSEAMALLENLPVQVVTALRGETLNEFMALGRSAWTATRKAISQLLQAEEATLRDDASLRELVLVPQTAVEMVLPAAIGDYTDFYSSREHATNVGTMLRGAQNALQANWLHLPVAYHGRASSIVVSGTDLHRPWGQTKADDAIAPTFGPSRNLDFELEMGFFVGPGNELGRPIPIAEARDQIFGMVLVNDWSARDIQKWEYVPLGPFLAKNFGTSISPWVVTLDALEPFRVAGPAQDPEPLDYLKAPGLQAFDIQLEVSLQTANMPGPQRISVSNARHLYWNYAQQLAHHTMNGCNLRPGDLLASGTISGPTPDSYGSLLELAWKGTKPLTLPGGETRAFLQDGDRVTMMGWCQGRGYRVGFGEVTGSHQGVFIVDITPRVMPGATQARGLMAITLCGVRVHNLKDIEVNLPLQRISVLTGVSGSGKSSLAFDTLYAEARRRYLHCSSAESPSDLEMPDADHIDNLPPPIAVGQRMTAADTRATVGSLTEIAEDLRLLAARAGTIHCLACGTPVHAATIADVVGVLEAMPEGSAFTIGFPSQPPTDFAAWAEALREQGFIRAQIDGRLVRLDESPLPTIAEPRHCIVLIDRLAVGRSAPQRLVDSLEAAFVRGEGRLTILTGDQERSFDQRLACPICKGNGQGVKSFIGRLGGRTVEELCTLSVQELAEFCAELDLADAQRSNAQWPLGQMRARLQFLLAVELGHLTLDRSVRSLSSGECRRVRLAAGLASGLVNAMYVLDMPTAGLHPRDTDKVLAALRRLGDAGNTLVVVEHNAQLIRAADHVIDLGPGAGEEGGQVVYQGPPAGLVDCQASLTGACLSGRQAIAVPGQRRPLDHGSLRLVGARANNLKESTFEFPLGVLCVITGVSGAGKSSLVRDTLYPALWRHHHPKGTPEDLPAETAIHGAEQLGDVVLIDQTPLGRNARSQIATYIKASDDIRQAFAENKLQRPSLDEVLKLTAREAFRFFRAQPAIQRRLKPLLDVGLEYLRLGQPADTLSGGECLRLKLAGHFAARGKPRSLFLVDEPSTGLHPAELSRLLDCFDRLLQTGHSLIAIEHNLDIVKCADHVIDLGPGAGPDGGRVVALGTPEQVARMEASHTGRWLRRVLPCWF